MVFTGADENDSWNLVRGTIDLDAPMKRGGEWVRGEGRGDGAAGTELSSGAAEPESGNGAAGTAVARDAAAAGEAPAAE
jgi:hypothetical protein